MISWGKLAIRTRELGLSLKAELFYCYIRSSSGYTEEFITNNVALGFRTIDWDKWDPLLCTQYWIPTLLSIVPIDRMCRHWKPCIRSTQLQTFIYVPEGINYLIRIFPLLSYIEGLPWWCWGSFKYLTQSSHSNFYIAWFILLVDVIFWVIQDDKELYGGSLTRRSKCRLPLESLP